MRNGLLFLILGSLLGLQATQLGGVWWLLGWPGVSSGLVGLAYLGLGPRVFGKRPNGTMAWHSVLLLLPHLLLTWSVWHLMRLLSNEDCSNEVVRGLFIGRRPLGGELPDEVQLVVDLTAEFPERREVRHGREYLAAPILDDGIAAENDFASLVRRIAAFPGPVYIHCAQGHGRACMVAAGVLVAKGACATAEDAVGLLRARRPRLALRSSQLALVRRVCESQFPVSAASSA